MGLWDNCFKILQSKAYNTETHSYEVKATHENLKLFCESLEALLNVAKCPNECTEGALQVGESDWIPCEWCGRKKDLLK